MKKLISFLLIICVTFSVVGCKPSNSINSGDSVSEYDENAGVDFNSTPTAVVYDGETNYSIVIPANASESEIYAAEELQSFIEQATTARLEIIRDNEAVISTSQKYFSIGKTTILEYLKNQKKFIVDYESLNFDGFVIKTVDELFVFDSYNDRGIIYSVYDFLEKFVGVKFIAVETTYVPTNSNDLLVYDLDIVEVPAFEYRSYMSPMISGDIAFSTRMRMVHDYAQNTAKYGYNILQDFYNNISHNFTDLVLIDEWYEKHPEWFSAKKEHKSNCRDGLCIDPEYFAEHGKHKQTCLDLCTKADCVVDDRTEICLTSGIKDYKLDESTSESVVKVVIEKLKEQIREKQSARYFFVSQEDLGDPCNCSNCIASDEENGGAAGTLVVFLNVISDEIQKWLDTYDKDREVNIVSLAYEYTLNPPVKMENDKIVPVNEHVVANKNIFMRIAPLHQCYYHPFSQACEKNSKIIRIFDGWEVICDNFMIWDYAVNYTEFLFNYPNYSSMKDNLLFYKDLGVVYTMSQGMHKGEMGMAYQEKVKLYVASKLMWNPYRDVNKLIKEFNLYYFGEEIAPYIDEYMSISELHYAILDKTEENGFHTYTYDNWGFLEADFYSKNYLEHLTKILEDALNKVSTLELSDVEKDKLEVKILRVLISVQKMVIRNYSSYYDLSTELDYVKQFVENAERIGLMYISEGTTLSQFKESYNLI